MGRAMAVDNWPADEDGQPVQAKLEEELKPLLQVLAAIEQKIEGGDQIPDFGTLATWAAGEAARNGAGGGRKTGAGRDQPAQITIDMGGERVAQGADPMCLFQSPMLRRGARSAPPPEGFRGKHCLGR